MTNDCIFCKIVRGEIPSYQIFEDTDFLVFLDAFPSHKGHTLIIPKEHYADIFEMPSELADRIMGIGKKIAHAMKQSINADGYNFVQNNGEISGQAVMHYHLHIIPRYDNEPTGAKNMFTQDESSYKPTKEEFINITEKIKSALQ